MKSLAQRLILVMLFAVFMQQNLAYAIPAYPESVEVSQPNGVKFKLRLHGDEFFSWSETEDAYAIVQDARDKYWKYAKPARDKAGFDIIPGAIVGTADPAALNLKQGALPDPALLKQRVEKSMQSTRGLAVPSAASPLLSAPAPSEGPDAPALGVPTVGVTSIRNIVILACFNDHWNGGAGTVLSTKGRTDTSEYDQLCNQTAYAADGAVGSVADYYAECSYGKLSITSVVTPWVRLPQNEAYYGADSADTDTNFEQMITDAVNAADAAGFNFSQGDMDGDGWVDVLTVIHSGHAQEYGGNPSTCIWSKQGDMDSVVTKDGVNMKRCHTEPALRGNTSTTSIVRIGVLCHEMGHFFGLPDLYDYSNATNGVGDWCVMAQGSWNGSDGKRPAHFCAYSKYMIGFASPTQVYSAADISIARVEDNPVIHLIKNSSANGEYFLVENRARAGFDNDSAIFPGLLVQHVYEPSANNDLGSWAHPLLKIEEADGNNSLGLKTASSEAGDVWTGASGLAGGFRDQTGSAGTNAMKYQSTHDYYRNDSAASYSYVRLNAFSAAGDLMSYTLSMLKPDVLDQTVSTSAYAVSWGACTNATKYEIQEGIPTVLGTFTDSAENESFMYDNWRRSGTVLRDNRGARTGSYSYAMHWYYEGKWYSDVQSLTMASPFKVTEATVISFYLLSHFVSGGGYLECQISNDNGLTWMTLGSYGDYIDPWALESYNYAAIHALGINANDICTMRFVANFESTQGWSDFPGFGYAIDDISISNTEINVLGNWATLNSIVPTNSYNVTGKPNGAYPYRVRAYSNGGWQEFGAPGLVTVSTDGVYDVTFLTDDTPDASIDGETSQVVLDGEDCTEVFAVAPEGYSFVYWTANDVLYFTENPLTLTNVAQDMTVVAHFRSTDMPAASACGLGLLIIAVSAIGARLARRKSE